MLGSTRASRKPAPSVTKFRGRRFATPEKDALVSPPDDRARTGIREELDQHRVRHLAVEDDHRLDALFQRVDAGLDLRDHAARDRAVGDQAPALLDRQFGDQHLVLGQDARNVGEEQQALGVPCTLR
eukprot:TRINITY_DN32013_c0_g1_i1.p1 TRINITY_DN32013_c0_g1~~TRINITY_DN32013_c0_g1_i1.p1  ORF type:complete len:127 (+),score=1.38 TRINITY_DN32013_c0_g1_i1:310-690(+)